MYLVQLAWGRAPNHVCVYLTRTGLEGEPWEWDETGTQFSKAHALMLAREFGGVVVPC